MDSSLIDWKGEAPVSKQFQDIYFSSEDGLQESEYVFIRGNQLRERWQKTSLFQIGELGFGTGLNFLATWMDWKSDPLNEKSRLHYFSCEKYPLSTEDLSLALVKWPELKTFADSFTQSYSTPLRGFHRFFFEEGRVVLTLMIGDALASLRQMTLPLDAWYLDGFAPARNPEMWTPEVFRELNRLSRVGTTFSTFTAASQVRKDLEASGFEVLKEKGFGKKREMLSGRFAKPCSTLKPSSEPWYVWPTQTSQSQEAVVIGGGLAGTSAAAALAQKGMKVLLIEREPVLASQASGNPMGLIMPILTSEPVALSRFSLAAFAFATRHLESERGWQPSGLLKLAHTESEKKKQERALKSFDFPHGFLQSLDSAAASEMAGVPLSQDAIYFTKGGWIHPRELCLKNIDHPGIETRLETSALSFTREENNWKIQDASGKTFVKTENLVIANAIDSLAFPQLSWLPLRKVRGQIAYLPPQVEWNQLKLPISYDGYLTPDVGGFHVLGATYDWESEDTALRSSDVSEMFELLQARIPPLGHALPNYQSLSEGRVAFRTATSDKLPMVGAVPDIEWFCENYPDLHLGRDPSQYPLAQSLPGLYLLVGLGSYGITYAPLAAEVLASLMTGESPPLEQDLLNELNPARFIIRRLRRAL